MIIFWNNPLPAATTRLASPPPAILMPDLRAATRGVVEECTNELDMAKAPKTTALTFLVDLGGGFVSIVRCTRIGSTVHASVSIDFVKHGGGLPR